MHPVGAQQEEQKDDRAERPGNRVRPEYHLDLRNKMNGDGDIEHPDDAPAAHHHKHRHRRPSGAAHDALEGLLQAHAAVSGRIH